MRVRRPWWLWTPIAAGIGVAGPYLLLAQEGGFSQLVLIGAVITTVVGFALTAVAWRAGRPPTARLALCVRFLTVGAVTAIALSLLYFIALGLAAEFASDPSPRLDPFLWLVGAVAGLMVAIPYAMAIGLVAGLVAFWKMPPAEDAGAGDPRP
jgi:hypothetical protein